MAASPITSTPIQSTNKRMLSSPDDATENKRDRKQSPTFHVSTSGSASATESSCEQIQFMVKNLGETMIPEIVKCLDSSLSNKVSAIEAENLELWERVKAS